MRLLYSLHRAHVSVNTSQIIGNSHCLVNNLLRPPTNKSSEPCIITSLWGEATGDRWKGPLMRTSVHAMTSSDTFPDRVPDFYFTPIWCHHVLLRNHAVILYTITTMKATAIKIAKGWINRYHILSCTDIDDRHEFLITKHLCWRKMVFV